MLSAGRRRLEALLAPHRGGKLGGHGTWPRKTLEIRTEGSFPKIPKQRSQRPVLPVGTEAGRVFALGDDEFGQCAGSGSHRPSLRSDLCGSLWSAMVIRFNSFHQSMKGGAAAIPLPSTQLAVGEGMMAWRSPNLSW